MRRMRVLPTLVVVVLSALLVAGDAGASGGDVIDDCTTHGTLTKRYSQRDYRQALSQLPADVDEYGNCRDVIRNAQVAGAGDDGGGSGTGGAGPAGFRAPSTPGVTTAAGTGGTSTAHVGGGGKGDDPTAVDPTDPRNDNPTNTDENRALIEATRNGGGPVKVGRDAIEPGAQNSSFVQNLPAPMIAILALLGVGALTGGVLALRRRLRSNN
jgi:hypothetical protein